MIEPDDPAMQQAQKKAEEYSEAIALCNDRDFGLAASVWTKDLRNARHFSQMVQAGTIWINCYGHFDPAAPWGGMKLSGRGRELGEEGIMPFFQSKTIMQFNF